MDSLKDQTAIVTGASRGYGKGIAKVLIDAGAKVWITGRNAVALENAAEDIGARAFVADVNDGEGWDRLISEITEDSGCPSMEGKAEEGLGGS